MFGALPKPRQLGLSPSAEYSHLGLQLPQLPWLARQLKGTKVVVRLVWWREGPDELYRGSQLSRRGLGPSRGEMSLGPTLGAVAWMAGSGAFVFWM